MSKKHMKKQKLLAGVCIPLVTAGVALGTAAAVLLSRNKPVAPTQGDYTLSFYTDDSSRFVDNTFQEQRVYARTTLDRICQPEVQSYRPNFMFAGWQDEKGQPVPGQYKIVRDTKLTASFGDTTTGDYCTVTFKTKTEEPNVKLHGNVSIAVKKGYLFLMVNRPTAEWSDNYFENWQYKEGDTYYDVTESTPITSNMVLYPKFTKAVTVTWDPGVGGRILRGQATTKLAAGTTFGHFNQPQLVNDDLTKVFDHWEKADGSTWSETEVVTENTTAVAAWVTGKVGTDHHLLQFVQNEEQTKAETPYPEVIFAPSTSTIVANGTKWADATKPDVYTADGNYEIASWQYKKADGSWDTLDKDHTFTTASEATSSTQIRPVMKSSITGVTIDGKDTVLPESDTKYTAVVAGTSTNPGVSKDVTWTLSYDAEGGSKVPKEVAEISADGLLSVKSITTSATIYAIATSTASVTKQVGTKEITINMPYVDSQKIWYHNGKQWFSISQKDGLCDGTKSSMPSYALNASYGSKGETIVKSTDFDYKLYIGRQLTELYQQFGYNWTGFNGEIDFGTNLKKIKASFLENCTRFNQELDLTYITEIGNNFLCGCINFGECKTSEGFVYDSMLTFGSNLTTIGKNFLMGCERYNRDLNLPNTALTIGQGFLYWCSNFNRDITIPANVVYVGDHFMTMCDSFTSTITIGSTSTTFEPNPNSISSTNNGAPIYYDGFSVAGDGGNQFANTFPTSYLNNAFRTIKKAAPTTELLTKAQWENAMSTIFTTDLSNKNFAYIPPNDTCDTNPRNYGIFTIDSGKVLTSEEDMTGTTWYLAKQQKPGGTIKYNNAIYNYSFVDDKTAKFTGTCAPYSLTLNGKTGYYDQYYRSTIGTMARGFINSFPYTDGQTGNWIYNSTTGRYEHDASTTAFPIDTLENGTKKFYGKISVEFEAYNDVPMVSKIILEEDNSPMDPITYVHTFGKYGGVQIGYELQGDTVDVLTAEGTTGVTTETTINQETGSIVYLAIDTANLPAAVTAAWPSLYMDIQVVNDATTPVAQDISDCTWYLDGHRNDWSANWGPYGGEGPVWDKTNNKWVITLTDDGTTSIGQANDVIFIQLHVNETLSKIKWRPIITFRNA